VEKYDNKKTSIQEKDSIVKNLAENDHKVNKQLMVQKKMEFFMQEILSFFSYVLWKDLCHMLQEQ
jgi:hypothetical protein